MYCISCLQPSTIKPFNTSDVAYDAEDGSGLGFVQFAREWLGHWEEGAVGRAGGAFYEEMGAGPGGAAVEAGADSTECDCVAERCPKVYVLESDWSI